jgi:hypothetical protein
MRQQASPSSFASPTDARHEFIKIPVFKQDYLFPRLQRANQSYWGTAKVDAHGLVKRGTIHDRFVTDINLDKRVVIMSKLKITTTTLVLGLLVVASLVFVAYAFCQTAVLNQRLEAVHHTFW